MVLAVGEDSVLVEIKPPITISIKTFSLCMSVKVCVASVVIMYAFCVMVLAVGEDSVLVEIRPPLYTAFMQFLWLFSNPVFQRVCKSCYYVCILSDSGMCAPLDHDHTFDDF